MLAAARGRRLAQRSTCRVVTHTRSADCLPPALLALARDSQLLSVSRSLSAGAHRAELLAGAKVAVEEPRGQAARIEDEGRPVLPTEHSNTLAGTRRWALTRVG